MSGARETSYMLSWTGRVIRRCDQAGSRFTSKALSSDLSFPTLDRAHTKGPCGDIMYRRAVPRPRKAVAKVCRCS